MAVAGIGCSSLFGIPWADPVGGLAVSALLLRTSISNASTPLLSLLDYTPPPNPELSNTLSKALTACNEDGLTRTLKSCRFVTKNGQSTLHAAIGYPAETTLERINHDTEILQAVAQEMDEEYRHVAVVVKPEVQK